MKVSRLMTKNVSFADLETTLEEIATMMRDENVGSIPVLDGEKVVGIVTDRDIVLRCIAEGRDPVGTTSQDILSGDVTTIRPNDDLDVAAQLMAQRQVRRLPVVDASGKLLGMLSLGDIAVKEDGDSESAQALEGVSRGVKDEGSRGDQHIERGRQDDADEFALEIEEEFQYAQPRGSNRRGAPSKRADKPRPAVSLGSRGGKIGKGRGVAMEKKRQHKVVPIRGKARSSRQKRAS